MKHPKSLTQVEPMFAFISHQCDQYSHPMEQILTEHALLSAGQNPDLYQNLDLFSRVWSNRQIILRFPILLVVSTFVNFFL